MMETQTKECKDHSSLEQGVLTDNNVLLPICDNSAESPEFVSPGEDRSDLRNMGSNRLMDKKIDYNETKGESVFLHGTTLPVQVKNNCHFFLIKEYSTETNNQVKLNQTASNVPRLLAPKFTETSNVIPAKRSFVIETHKKRDEKRRATHNEVERRRRDKINSWIFKLKELIPESEGNNSPVETKCKANASDSKSKILIRACEYIKEMQEELKSLRSCLMENNSKYLEKEQLQIEMDAVKNSGEQSIDKINNIKCKRTEDRSY